VFRKVFRLATTPPISESRRQRRHMLIAHAARPNPAALFARSERTDRRHTTGSTPKGMRPARFFTRPVRPSLTSSKEPSEFDRRVQIRHSRPLSSQMTSIAISRIRISGPFGIFASLPPAASDAFSRTTGGNSQCRFCWRPKKDAHAANSVVGCRQAGEVFYSVPNQVSALQATSPESLSHSNFDRGGDRPAILWVLLAEADVLWGHLETTATVPCRGVPARLALKKQRLCSLCLQRAPGGRRDPGRSGKDTQ
jgi:hypothetical protein